MTDVLDTLEKRVADAAAKLGELREENSTLRARVAELAVAHPGSEAAWEREREQIRKRVEKLAARLEALLSP